MHYSFECQYIVITNGAEVGLGPVMYQNYRVDKLLPIGYQLSQGLPAEIYYNIHNLELLAIVDSLKI
jgi:hypothetical protein